LDIPVSQEWVGCFDGDHFFELICLLLPITPLYLFVNEVNCFLMATQVRLIWTPVGIHNFEKYFLVLQPESGFAISDYELKVLNQHSFTVQYLIQVGDLVVENHARVVRSTGGIAVFRWVAVLVTAICACFIGTSFVGWAFGSSDAETSVFCVAGEGASSMAMVVTVMSLLVFPSLPNMPANLPYFQEENAIDAAGTTFHRSLMSSDSSHD